MQPTPTCPECGASWQDGISCQEAFYQMLFWEAELPGYGEVHHLMVLCYHLQHPSLYSPEGLRFGMLLLEDFLEQGITPEQVRQLKSSQVDSNQRGWKIKGTPGSQGAYPHPIHWEMTATGVIARGEDRYMDSVREWARAVLDDLSRSGNLPDP